MKLVIFTLLLCSSAERSSPYATVSRRRRQQSKHWPEHHDQVLATHSGRCRGQRPRRHDQVPATHKARRRGQRPDHHDKLPVTVYCRLICRVLFSCCGSTAWPKAVVWAPAWAPLSRTCDQSYVVDPLAPNDSTSSKVNLCVCNLVFVHIKLVLFTLILCSSADSSSPYAAASRPSRQSKQRFKQRPEHHDQVRVTHSERRRGKQLRHHDQVPATHKERPRGQKFGHPVTINFRGQPPGRHNQVPAWRRGHLPTGQVSSYLLAPHTNGRRDVPGVGL
jgi:hypothetical protein